MHAANAVVGGGVLDDVVAGGLRLVLYAGFVLLVGTAFFITWLWPAGRSVRTLEWMMTAGGVLTLLATVLLPYVAPGSDPRGFGPLDGREGACTWARIALVAVMLAGQPTFVRSARAARGWSTLWQLALIETYVLMSDAWGGLWPVLKIVATTGHLFATAAWLGGLLALASVLIPTGSLDAVGEVLPTFSYVALISVVTLIMTGAIHAYAVAGSLSALFHSSYGVVLLVKIGVLGAMLLLGNIGRAHAERLYQRRGAETPGEPGAGADSAAGSAFAVAVGAELALAVGVLVATAFLVHAVPALGS